MYKLKIKLFFLVSIFFLFTGLLFADIIDKEMEQATTLVNTGKYQEAINIYEEILRTEPHNLKVLYSAAYSYLHIGRADVAHTYLRRFIARNDKDADVYNLFGLANERTGYSNEALENYTKAISLDSNFYEAYFNRGRCYSALQNLSAARADYNIAKRNKIITPALYYASGELYFYLKQYDSAIIDFEKILNFKTENHQYYTMLGDSYYSLGPNDTAKLNKAIDYYSKSLQLHSENVMVLKNRAFVYDKLEQYEKAEADRDKIREIQLKTGLNPNSVSYKQLVHPDKYFSMLVPQSWKALMDVTSDSVSMLLYDSLIIKHDTIPEGYVFEYGCEIKFYKNLFNYDSNNINQAVALRDAKFAEELAARAKTRRETAVRYSELSKKHFNPNRDIAREIIKINISVKYSATRFFRIEYFCVTTTGHMLRVSLWVPEKESLYYEALLDHIVSTIAIPAVER